MEVDINALSPMMKQYMALKQQYEGYILFFRLGDFYEMFFDDATLVARELEITLTGRDCGLENRAPMCGVPFHSSENYIKRLVDKGYKVAICEQTSDPALSKGLVEREVIRVVTPGTLIESSMLDEGTNNYICSVYASIDKKEAGIAFADLSTGSVIVSEFSGKKLQADIITELSRYSPAEVLFNQHFLDYKEVHIYIRDKLSSCVSTLCDDTDFSDKQAFESQLSSELYADIDLKGKPLAFSCLCGLFKYILNTQKSTVKRFTSFEYYSGDEFVGIDLSARRNLELCETLRGRERKGTLLWVLDSTKTSMGKRLLKACIEQPLTNHNRILRRLDAVEQLCASSISLSELTESLGGVYDLERLMTRIMYATASPRDVKALAFTAQKLPLIKQLLVDFSAPLVIELNKNISTLEEIRLLIDNAIVDEPPVHTRDGGMIRDGFNEKLDNLRAIITGSNDILGTIEKNEREKTGIRTLKVGYNRVFGYYIEISRSYAGSLPDNYIRKQTLANNERYITEELKNIESQILGANEKILALEQEIFNEVRDFIATKLKEVQSTASAIAQLDVLCSFASVSLKNGYCRPDITLDNVIDIQDGRHPVVEEIQTGELFVPNNTYLDTAQNRMVILTGPNMSGKSTYMRQVALIVIMAQMGCFVPAKSARIGVVDKIFTRIGASDDLTSGQSTFMVEMSEVADILRNATRRSLVILDEVGRGTSTFDGISIARAVAEYISQSKQLSCKTLFATHYHELIELEQELEGVKNYSVAVKRYGDSVKFLRKIVPGGVDDSYGIEVAKLAGIPDRVVKRAKELLAQMETSQKQQLNKALMAADDEQLSFEELEQQKLIKRLRQIDLDELTPRECMMVLEELKGFLN